MPSFAYCTHFRNQTLLVVGLAREGRVAARWLAEHDAHVIVSDIKPAADLAQDMAELQRLGIDIRLGPQTPELLAGIDAIVASPGVPQDIPLFATARQAGIPITTETKLFAQLCPAPVVGITGSSGKTTTTTLVAEILNASGRKTWLGGNIGAPLLGQVEAISPVDCSVLELSSFQLLYWAGAGAASGPHPDTFPWADPAGVSPHIAAITNITPNHLDRHPSMAHYAAAKAQILAYQTDAGIAILNRDDPALSAWAGDRRVIIAAGAGQDAVDFPLTARILTFGLDSPPAPGQDGAWPQRGHIWLRWQEREQAILPIAEVRLRGQHNLANCLAACCISAAAGAQPHAMAQVISAFTGVAHRLEEVRRRNGVLWINDSIATSPERAIAALRSFDAPIILLAGGRDKHLPWAEWAIAAHTHARAVITFGEAAPLIAAALASAPHPSALLHHGGDLEHAVALASALAQPGDVVLLSPGGVSFDAYADFTLRGQHFRHLVHSLP